MASGLIALLDDVAAIAKVAAASVDDIAAQSLKAGSKAAGIVIDDTAVTPRYVVGFAADRELPIIWKIAIGSLRNKILMLLPGALILSSFAPWLIPPLLIVGGLFLCYEGYEKLHSMIAPHSHEVAHEHNHAAEEATLTPQELEAEKVSGAVRTDFILSAEIMALTLSTVADQSFVMQAIVLTAVGIGITAAVYGVVAIIVKADDAGAALARTGKPGIASLGRLIVKAMPGFLSLLTVIGTFAMLWVGGDIVLHSLAQFGIDAPEHLIKDNAKEFASALPLSGFFSWLLGAIASGIIGTVLGAIVVPIVTYVIMPLMRLFKRKEKAA